MPHRLRAHRTPRTATLAGLAYRVGPASMPTPVERQQETQGTTAHGVEKYMRGVSEDHKKVRRDQAQQSVTSSWALAKTA